MFELLPVVYILFLFITSKNKKVITKKIYLIGLNLLIFFYLDEKRDQRYGAP